MTEDDYKKRAIENYGLPLSRNVLWFIDECKTYYAVHDGGKVEHFISGYITGNVFAVDFTSINDDIDSLGWTHFLSSFDLEILDNRI